MNVSTTSPYSRISFRSSLAQKIRWYGGATSRLPSYEPWVLPPSHSVIASVAQDAFRASGLDYPSGTVITEPADVRMSLLATGRFISIFSDAVLRFSARRPELKVLPVKQALSRGEVSEVIKLQVQFRIGLTGFMKDRGA